MADIAARVHAKELCDGLPGDRAKVDAVIGHVARTVLYDHLKARTVRRGYKPDPDATLETRRGICWDIAALVDAMLRAVDHRADVRTVLESTDFLMTSARGANFMPFGAGGWYKCAQSN